MTRFKRFLGYCVLSVGLPAGWIGNIWWQNRDDPSIGGGIMVGIIFICPVIAAFTLCVCGIVDSFIFGDE